MRSRCLLAVSMNKCTLHTCIYVVIYTSLSICIFIYIYIYMCIYIYMQIYLCMFTYIYICVCVYIYMYMCIYIYVIYTFIYIHIHVYIYIYIYIYILCFHLVSHSSGTLEAPYGRLQVSFGAKTEPARISRDLKWKYWFCLFLYVMPLLGMFEPAFGLRTHGGHS